MNEPTQKDQIESVLADLAVQQVSERSPALFDHYLGFELIDKNEDGTRAAGLLGFAIGQTLAYIPILFMNGRVRGTEMIYLKDHDRFISNTKQWIDFLVNRNPGAMGEPDDYKPRGQVGLAQLQVFKSPNGGKAAGFGGQIEADPRVLATYGGMAGEENLIDLLGSEPRNKVANFEDVVKAEAYNDELSVVEFFKRAGAPELYKGFIKWATAEHPKIMEGLFRFYEADELKIAEFDPIREVQKRAADLLTSPGDVGEVEANLIVVTDPTSDEANDLDDEQKVKLMQTGIGIVDERGENLSVIVREEERQRYFNANETGIYDMVTKNHTTNEVLIVPSPFVIEDPTKSLPGTLIVDPETKVSNHTFQSSSGNNETDRPPVMGTDADGSKFEAFLGKTSPVSSMQVGKTYIMVDSKRKGVSAPFRIKNKAGNRFRAMTASEIGWMMTNPGGDFNRPKPKGTCAWDGSSGAWIEQADNDGDRPYQSGEALFVPQNFTVMSVDDQYEGADICCDPGENESQARQRQIHEVTPASESEVNLAIAAARGGIKTASFEGEGSMTHPLRLERNGLTGDWTMNWDNQSKSFRKKAGVIHTLLAGVGLGEEDARSLADEAGRGKKVACNIKVAYTGAIDIPWPDIDDSAGATAYSGTPQVQRVQQIQPGTVEQYDHKDPYDPEVADFDAIMQEMSSGAGGEITGVMERASQSGVKQVFDPAMVAMLLRTNRVQMQVESDYLPLLEKGVDRMCRLLLLFYWHNSDFSENYGQDELAEFEDVLLTSIKTVGQLTLFLRQKAVGSTSSGIDAFAEAV